MMLLDEPSAALAPQVVLDIFRTIGRICREGMTLLLVEQNGADGVAPCRVRLRPTRWRHPPRGTGGIADQ
jgi:ABC-type lipopolysaccharide export system ATPase subunit